MISEHNRKSTTQKQCPYKRKGKENGKQDIVTNT